MIMAGSAIFTYTRIFLTTFHLFLYTFQIFLYISLTIVKSEYVNGNRAYSV